MIWHALRARVSYWLARRLFHWQWLIKQPRAWQWMEGQFSRMANLGDRQAQSFYGHILLFRGQGLGARNEGRRLLSLAAKAGDAKSAYQLGVLSLAGDAQHEPDSSQALNWWTQAAQAGHPAAAYRLAELYRTGAPGVAPDAQLAAQFAAQSSPASHR
ncbi:sel1 repeat family protein [Pseudomonas sp. 5P_3.1_Bac2]|uniref:sel1 repeat family protein n=1 Tax=Pseudomonas sp. 5P_3.1_Bac2 TaxID=2971617 RepID=UPI0021C6EC2C|nr:sel1 repeat family protein [Pseudomonas sp. 5P_3.1_Bac2]MCU1716882.1 sel1 repeat family protein [Pseudomonas sp. 5P_3.1_Bac2]